MHVVDDALENMEEDLAAVEQDLNQAADSIATPLGFAIQEWTAGRRTPPAHIAGTWDLGIMGG